MFLFSFTAKSSFHWPTQSTKYWIVMHFNSSMKVLSFTLTVTPISNTTCHRVRTHDEQIWISIIHVDPDTERHGKHVDCRTKCTKLWTVVYVRVNRMILKDFFLQNDEPMHRHTHAQTKVILVAGKLVGEKRGIKRPLPYACTHSTLGFYFFLLLPSLCTLNRKLCMYI